MDMTHELSKHFSEFLTIIGASLLSIITALTGYRKVSKPSLRKAKKGLKEVVSFLNNDPKLKDKVKELTLNELAYKLQEKELKWEKKGL